MSGAQGKPEQTGSAFTPPVLSGHDSQPGMLVPAGGHLALSEVSLSLPARRWKYYGHVIEEKKLSMYRIVPKTKYLSSPKNQLCKGVSNCGLVRNKKIERQNSKDVMA